MSDDVCGQRFEGDFLQAADMMATGPVTLEISGYVKPNTEKDSRGKVIDKPIVAFKGAKKRLVLGKTNWKLIVAQHGEKWGGKPVQLEVRYLKEAFGEANVPCVRVIPPSDIPIPFSCRKFMGSPTPYNIGGK